MSATTSTTTAAPAQPAVDLDTGKDLTFLDDAQLAADLGLEPPTDGGPESGDAAADAETDILSSIANEVPADGQGTDDAEAAAEEGTPETPNDEPEAAKEPEPAAKPARELLAEFQVFDAEGELEIPELHLSFRADGGKPFDKVPLDKVVRLAQQGAYNHRLQQEVASARETQARLSEREETIQQLQSKIDQQLALAERLLTDPDFFDKALAEYSEYNAPEARLARLEAENKRLREAPKQQSSHDDGTQWFETNVMPAVDAIMSQNPTVEGRELLGQFMLLTSDMLVNGKIPSSARGRVQEILTAELLPWAQQLHEHRSADATEREQARKAAERAKVSATVVKRQLARATKPAGKPAPDKPIARPAGNADEAADSIIAGLFA